jgi:hypothetical protein
MKVVEHAAAWWADEIAAASTAIGRTARIDTHVVFDRSGDLALGRPGLRSPNHSCRLVRAADGWMAVNLPRADDREMVPAWLGEAVRGDPWRAIAAIAKERACTGLLDQARLLGLPVSIVGEVTVGDIAMPCQPIGTPAAHGRPPRVVDLTSMWAGPLCTALLAEAGMEVTRIESIHRPDPTRTATPAFYARLNDRKKHVALDFADPDGRARLADAVSAADIVVTSARPRAFEGMGITPETVAARNPALIWVAITGHGWTGEARDRVAFGDDAAAAGGLVRWTKSGAPRFAGDALADPLAGLAAAAAAMRALADGGAVLIDVALSRIAADAIRRSARSPADRGAAVDAVPSRPMSLRPTPAPPRPSSA